MEKYNVYIQTDETGLVIGINSDAFLPSTDGWEKVAEGHGDKFHHAQGNYLPEPLMDDEGHANWKLVNGTPVLRTSKEKANDPAPEEPPQTSTAEERIAELERLIAAQDQQIAMLLEGVTEDE